MHPRAGAKTADKPTAGPDAGPHPAPDVKPDTPLRVPEPFDFQSSRFGADALALARGTGRPMELCREQLFIAEGDLALAYALLVDGYAALQTDQPLH